LPIEAVKLRDIKQSLDCVRFLACSGQGQSECLHHFKIDRFDPRSKRGGDFECARYRLFRCP